MKLKHCLYLPIFLICAVLSPTILYAAENFTADEAHVWADNKGREILEIMTSDNVPEKYNRLDNILQNDVDLEYAARFVVGKYWKQMSEEQRTRYLDIFKRYTSALYKSYPLEIEKGDVTYTIDKIIADKNRQNVYCTVYVKAIEQKVDNNSKGGIHVIFVLVKDNGKIRVRDLKITETSFLLAYRERFYKMIYEDCDEEIDWFLDDLQQITEDTERENSAKMR